MNLTSVRRMLSLLAVVGMTAGLSGGMAASLLAQTTTAPPPPVPVPLVAPSVEQAPKAVATSPDDLWEIARAGDQKQLREAMQRLIDQSALAAEGSDGARFRQSLLTLQTSLDKREQTRSDKIAELDKNLDEKLVSAADDSTGKAHEPLSEALKLAVERFVLSINKDGFKAEPRIADLIQRADAAARAAEAKGDWFTANELFWRLHVLLEEEGSYRDDTKRLGLRLSMIRLYTPERFWELRNRERKLAGKSDLPPYNGLGEDFNEKLQAIDSGMVKRAVFAASKQHIDRVALREMMQGGILAVQTMATTSDLDSAFEGLKNPASKQAFADFLELWTTRLADPKTLILPQTLSDFVDDLVATNRTSVALPDGAVLHEFGNGAMGKLDDYSAIIWPDEVNRFNRMTEGKFKGVGVQIQMDEETQMIKVVTPLEGTPAMRAGVRSGDLIKKIDGKSAVGISLNQAVDLHDQMPHACDLFWLSSL